MLPVRGERVVLRRMAEGDLDRFLAYRSDPEVARYQSWEVMDRDRARGFLAHCAVVTPLLRPGHWVQIAVASSHDDRLLGDMGLFLSEDGTLAELGITLSRDAQGQGRAIEAMRLACDLVFGHTQAQRILGIADIRNAASLTLLQRAGFTFTHEESSEQDGQPITERFYALRRSDQP
ncbi:GNAT family N-acetyltransferase [Primorskyibacter aestuariivivens]|uniref:GNAT family N-acetyltransferase n=1 Tax=Primorskyibacter aestuariivivens TaxID=1888912 RepID=UPI00230088A8|nr:GNAT family N-acetyltransferase [Primorskyibacter aestuariivivens]MDA7427501.1 GNAT family N-acetyltransferase [Primorskyibacter aestuariivivens]